MLARLVARALALLVPGELGLRRTEEEQLETHGARRRALDCCVLVGEAANAMTDFPSIVSFESMAAWGGACSWRIAPSFGHTGDGVSTWATF